MYISDLDFTRLFEVSKNDNYFNSDKWFLAFINRIPSILKLMHGRREIFDFIARATDPTHDAAEMIDIFLYTHCYKYRHLWKLYTADYNPLWNVEGSETRVIERDVTTQDEGTRTDTGTVKNNASGTDTTTGTNTGTVTDAGTDNSSTTYGKTTQQARTTYDSSTAYNTDSSTDSGTDSEQRTTGNTRTDNLQSSSGTTYGRQDLRTDDLTSETSNTGEQHERTTDTFTRGGNLGVTKTTDLEQSEVDFVSQFNMVDMIVSDIADSISYIFM